MDKKPIAVIGGTGAEGSGIALRLAHAGYRVIIGSRNADKAVEIVRDLNTRLGDEPVSWETNEIAADKAEIVFLTVPYAAQRDTVVAIREKLTGKILVDATAPLVPPKVAQVQLPEGGSAVAAIQALLGEEVRVVSALQNVAAEKLRQLDTPVPCDVLVCADDPEARRQIMDLFAEAGLTGIDAGPIANSAAAEALTSVMIAINRAYKVKSAGIRIVGLNPNENTKTNRESREI